MELQRGDSGVDGKGYGEGRTGNEIYDYAVLVKELIALPPTHSYTHALRPSYLFISK